MKIKKEFKTSPLLKAMVDAMPELIFIFNKKGELEFTNNAVLEFIKVNGVSFKIKADNNLLKCSHYSKTCKNLEFCKACIMQSTIKKVLEEKKISNKEVVVSLDKEKEEKEFILNAVPFYMEDEIYALLTLRDISDLKIYEKQRIKDLEKLSLIGASVSTIVHDLKNPLTGIIGYISLLEKKLKTPLNSKLFKNLAVSIEKIKNMLEDILNIASGKNLVHLNRKKIKLSNYLKNLKEHIRTINKFEIQNSSNAEIYIDKEKFNNVFWNLIKNADEAFTEENGKISLIITEYENYFIFEVRDNGDGIPSEIQEKLFAVGKTFSKKNGKGFGLVSVKNIVESHRAKIYFTSQKGVGTSFYIKLYKGNE